MIFSKMMDIVGLDFQQLYRLARPFLNLAKREAWSAVSELKGKKSSTSYFQILMGNITTSFAVLLPIFLKA